MRGKRHWETFSTVLFSLLLTTTSFSQTSAIKITSPASGMVVEPGQKVTVVVVVDPKSNIRNVTVAGPDPLDLIGAALAPPYHFTFTIPQDITPKKYSLVARGNLPEQGEAIDYDTDSIELDVENPSPIVKLEVHPKELLMLDLEPDELSVTGTFDDGSQANLSESTRVTYTSDHPEVATVDRIGQVTFVGPGQAKITVSAGAVSAVATATFLKGPPPGPETTLVLTPPPNAQGWNNTDLHVNVTTVDDALGSGVKEIGISVAGNRQSHLTTVAGATASTAVTTEGDLRISVYAVDHAGNIGHQIVSDVLLDKTPPSISGLPVPCMVRLDGGSDQDKEERRVTVATVTASDALSGLAEFEVKVEPEEGRDILITGSGLGPRTVEIRVEGDGQRDHDRDRTFHLRARARDVAGNTASQDVTCTVIRSGHAGTR